MMSIIAFCSLNTLKDAASLVMNLTLLLKSTYARFRIYWINAHRALFVHLAFFSNS